MFDGNLCNAGLFPAELVPPEIIEQFFQSPMCGFRAIPASTKGKKPRAVKTITNVGYGSTVQRKRD